MISQAVNKPDQPSVGMHAKNTLMAGPASNAAYN